MSYPVTLANIDKNAKRKKSRLRITSLPAPTRLTQYVQLALSALICQDVCLSSALLSTPHTSRLFHVSQCRTQQRVKKVHDCRHLTAHWRATKRSMADTQNNVSILCSSRQTACSMVEVRRDA